MWRVQSALSSVEPGSAFKSTKSMAASVEQGPVSFRSGGSSGEVPPRAACLLHTPFHLCMPSLLHRKRQFEKLRFSWF